MKAEPTISLNELIKEASVGDVIQLKNQVYEGDVVIDKSIVLKGAENTVIKGTGTGDVITINHDGITLENITIRESGMILDHDYAGIKILSDHNRIKDITIEQTLHGIYLEESNHNELIGNAIVGNQSVNQSRRGNGIHLFHSSDNLIQDNSIHDTRDGIYFSFAENNEITGNHIFNNRYGLHYMYSDHNDFYQNEFYENTGGAAIMYSEDITLKENIFYDHHGLQSFGILLQTADNIELENNSIHFNQKGIFMDQSKGNTLKNNQIINNRIGLDIWASSKENVLTGNQILQNNLPYSSNGGKDANQWSDQGIGNAWSDYTIVDLDQDGIGDDTYTYQSSYGKVLAEQPLGALFLDSPALALYEKSHKFFGSEEGKVEDFFPINQSTSISSIPYIVLVVLLIGMFLWKLQKRWKTT